MMFYTKQIIDHFRNPRNQGAMKKPDGLGKIGNPKCGDVMKIYLKIKDDIVEDIKFETYGCGAAIATSSKMTELAKSKTIDEALKITKDKVLEGLGGKDVIPKEKYHCSILAVDAFKRAIEDYRARS